MHEKASASPDGSAERFADAARELWRGRAERGDLARRVRDYTAETHGVEVVTRSWERLVEELA